MHDPYYKKRLAKSRAMRAKRGNKTGKTLSEEIESVSRLLMWTMASLLIISGVSFLYVGSLQNAKGYHLQQLQQDHEDLLLQNRELQSSINQAQAITEVEEVEQVEAMNKPLRKDMTYVGPEVNLAAR